MTIRESKILELFKKNKIKENGVLDPQIIIGKSTANYTQYEMLEAINLLILESYISFDGEFYILLRKGYNFIYDIKVTEKNLENAL